MRAARSRFVRWLHLLLGLFVASLFVESTLAQTADDLVLVNVTVTAESGKLLATKLKQENFQIFEGKQLQQIQFFSTEDTPISLGVLFDVSGSMQGSHGENKLGITRQALSEFLQASNPRDELFVVAFSDHPIVTKIPELPNLQAKGRTALLDAVYLGIEKMRDAHNGRKVLLIISDGGDNASRYTEREIKQRLKEVDVQIDSICLLGQGPPIPEEVRGPGLLNELSELTGGVTFFTDQANDVLAAAKMLAEALRNPYVLGYRPKNTARDGRWRKIEVKVVHAKESKARHVYARAGYFAPSAPVLAK